MRYETFVSMLPNGFYYISRIDRFPGVYVIQKMIQQDGLAVARAINKYLDDFDGITISESGTIRLYKTGIGHKNVWVYGDLCSVLVNDMLDGYAKPDYQKWLQQGKIYNCFDKGRYYYHECEYCGTGHYTDMEYFLCLECGRQQQTVGGFKYNWKRRGMQPDVSNKTFKFNNSYQIDPDMSAKVSEDFMRQIEREVMLAMSVPKCYLEPFPATKEDEAFKLSREYKRYVNGIRIINKGYQNEAVIVELPAKFIPHDTHVKRPAGEKKYVLLKDTIPVYNNNRQKVTSEPQRSTEEYARFDTVHRLDIKSDCFLNGGRYLQAINKNQPLVVRKPNVEQMRNWLNDMVKENKNE